jgi:hypothetical protein
MDNLRTELLHAIRDIFTAERPQDMLFVDTAGQYFDVESASSDLKCKYWSELPIEALIKHRNIIGFLNDDGFYFYFPAFLSAIISEPYKVDTLTESVVYYLTPDESNDVPYQRFLRKVSKFSQREASVIARFFDAYFDLFPLDKWSHSSRDIGKILEASRFWVEMAEE